MPRPAKSAAVSGAPADAPATAVVDVVDPPDAHGYCSLGTSIEAMHAAVRAAKRVISC